MGGTPMPRSFFASFAEPVFQKKTPSYSQGVGSYYDAEPVSKWERAGETAFKPTGKPNRPTGMASNNTDK